VGRMLNEIFLTSTTDKKGKPVIQYTVFNKSSLDPAKKGEIVEGQSFPTGWMGLEVKVLRYHPYAREEWDVKIRKTPTDLTTAAVQVSFNGTQRWLLLNDTIKLFAEHAVYFVAYVNRRIDLGFLLQLKDFSVDRYQGSTRAAGYKSLVAVPELGNREISMNEPLDHKGLKIYQASFQDGPLGNPVASIFSVNYDPGRWLKYLGSLIMVLGIILLFYFRKKAGKKASP